MIARVDDDTDFFRTQHTLRIVGDNRVVVGQPVGCAEEPEWRHNDSVASSVEQGWACSLIH